MTFFCSTINQETRFKARAIIVVKHRSGCSRTQCYIHFDIFVTLSCGVDFLSALNVTACNATILRTCTFPNDYLILFGLSWVMFGHNLRLFVNVIVCRLVSIIDVDTDHKCHK